MRTLILAAGQSRRFLQEGILIPKPFLLIEWRGTVLMMLEHVINTVPLHFDVSVAIPANSPALTISRHVNIYEVPQTKGPAHTALQAMNMMEEESTLIIDVDMLNFTNDLCHLASLSCCGVLVGHSTNPAFSYVDNLGPFIHIKEKVRISNYAVRGAYFIPISLRQEFIKCLEQAIGNKSEPFISHAFDSMRSEKFSIKTTYVPIDWGTPRDIRISGAHIIYNKGL